MYANPKYQSGVSPYSTSPGIASESGTTNNINLQSQSQLIAQSPYNPYLSTPAPGATYGSPQTSSSQRDMGQGVYIPIPDQRWRPTSHIPTVGANTGLDSGSIGVQPVFWNQGTSREQGQVGQTNGLNGESGVMEPINDVAMEIGNVSFLSAYAVIYLYIAHTGSAASNALRAYIPLTFPPISIFFRLTTPRQLGPYIQIILYRRYRSIILIIPHIP